MTQAEQQQAARDFAAFWKDKGDEKQETQRYWIGLLDSVLGIKNASNYIEFEKPVKLKHTSFIDGYIAGTKVLIEQKGSKIDLAKAYPQSDGSTLTPFQQAKRYADELAHDLHPRWIVVSNFREIHVHDMNRPHHEPEVILLENLEKEFYRLSFLTEQENVHLKRELELSVKAGEIVGLMYDKLLARYQLVKNLDMEKCLKSLNMLCVRIVFCLYAEDAGIFGHKSMFGDYLNHFEAKDLRSALLNLFKVLDQRLEDRDPFLEEELASFPYVNGGLFTEEDQLIPQFTDELKDLLVKKASDNFNWAEISPTIFGAVFESTLNPETRRTGGMHYTSIENIHKVIDPLFMDDLTEEFERITELRQEKIRRAKLIDFQKKLGNLQFLDPACGSGNFLTETYLSLRRLENRVISILNKGEKVLGFDEFIKVRIDQFYGIEINDFAVVVAKTALWIAESQMMAETASILQRNLDFLPLKSYATIVEGNALRIDWKTVVPKDKLDYIMGNPPFVGNNNLTAEQRLDLLPYFPNNKTMDYVAAWYVIATRFIVGTRIRCAFVSTNSITQGEQVALLWKPLSDDYGVHIDFAHRTFRWDSEANIKAHVHCVIVGFSVAHNNRAKIIYSAERPQIVENINAYLLNGDDVFVVSRTKPLCKVSEIRKGNQPTDGGNLIIEADEIEDFLRNEPFAKPYIKKLIGAKEYINNLDRYCLWLVGVKPEEIRKMPLVMERVKKVREMRLSSPDKGTQRLADYPTLFRETNNPKTFIVVPSVSSENRKYIPMGFLDENTIPTNLVLIIPDASLCHFGVLTSNVHMAWMRAVCGRLKSDYRYSKDIVYNNFPWCNPTAEQKKKIEETAQAILEARGLYPDSSLADLYDEVAMPPELRKAHQANDKAVMQAYGFLTKAPVLSKGLSPLTEGEIVAELFRMYERLAGLGAGGLKKTEGR